MIGSESAGNQQGEERVDWRGDPKHPILHGTKAQFRHEGIGYRCDGDGLDRLNVMTRSLLGQCAEWVAQTVDSNHIGLIALQKHCAPPHGTTFHKISRMGKCGAAA
ncbi:hypothetical protein FE257_000344 [Aspergillus nanangensis]|uniref:Uncharacterized protein n=1 Tax=Aspergillus nanangensis TaxID=2582783 RepID=A0AAD4H168_ASPNN|nr:hypothetical protein FE257_000344 [Aspergillus nanangensis]